MLTQSSLFAFSALLMTLSTALLIWMYGVVNGKETLLEETSGNIKRRDNLKAQESKSR